jgi:hypothetical protein
MLKRLTLAISVLSLSAGAALAQVASCPEVELRDRRDRAKVDATASLLTRLLSNLQIAGEYEREVKARLPNSDDRFLGLVQYRTSCLIIMSDTGLSTVQRLDMLRREYASIFLLSAPPPLQGVTTAPSAPRASPPPRPTFSGSTPNAPLVEQQLAQSPPPAQPPRGDAVIVRVFMKSDLREPGVVALRRALPASFDVRIGNSDVRPDFSADTLFVNRDKVHEHEVIRVIRTLGAQGVHIKSIQQGIMGGRREIQVGTIASDVAQTGQEFANTPPLDPSELAKLQGPDFWRAGFNGYVSCSSGIGRGYSCAMSADARPVPTR